MECNHLRRVYHPIGSVRLWLAAATCLLALAVTPGDLFAQADDQALLNRYQVYWNQVANELGRGGTNCNVVTQLLERWQTARQAALDTLFAQSRGLANRLDEDQYDLIDIQLERLVESLSTTSVHCRRNDRFIRAIAVVERLMSLGES